MNVLLARHLTHMKTVETRSLQILDSQAGICGVGEQWEMTDISRASSYTIQGAFGEPMTPTVQGFLGPDKLPAVLVPGKKEWYLLANAYTGASGKLAIFTENSAVLLENGPIVLEADSCQDLIMQAIQKGAQTHVADQVKGIHILHPGSMTTMAHVQSSNM